MQLIVHRLNVKIKKKDTSAVMQPITEPSVNAPTNTKTNSPKLRRIPTKFNSELSGPVLYLLMDLQYTYRHNRCFKQYSQRLLLLVILRNTFNAPCMTHTCMDTAQWSNSSWATFKVNLKSVEFKFPFIR